MSETHQDKKENYRAWDIQPLQSLDVSREELLLHCAGWAVLAPNSHNAQPWKFRIAPRAGTIALCADADYILPASDKACRQTYISIGCALENLLVAADAYGLDYEVAYAAGTPVYPAPIATVRFIISEACARNVQPELFDALKQRRMNRGKYDSLRKLPEPFIAESEAVCNGLGLALDVIRDAATRFAVADIQYSADKAVVILNSFRKELADYLLPNDTLFFRGMPGNTFGLNDEMASRVHNELRKDGSFDPDLAFGFAASGRDGIKSSPALLVISVPQDNSAWWVKAGMAFERIALLAQCRGLAVAVHAAIVEVAMFNNLLKLRLRRKERPTVIFRVGYATEERPHAPRVGAAECSEVIR